ncbi:hypothetical protein BDN70DRAFT_406647 [Pholiota conissans]|uniref:Uncharacterized protein n=1 Tax=Pholiota conissans TaxID=109636 RepID=A0A9P6CTM7_9AGAR|nr:hypothetical protein BDN70DRAFT_406647 [Pholiota conissans]
MYGQRTTAFHIRSAGYLPRCDGENYYLLVSDLDPWSIIRAHIPLNRTTAVWCGANKSLWLWIWLRLCSCVLVRLSHVWLFLLLSDTYNSHTLDELII